MAGFYQEMQGIAADLLGEFKQGVIQYVGIVPGNGPPDNPGETQETPVAVDAVARGVSFKYIDGSTVLTTDLQITMPGNGVEPDPAGFMIVDGRRAKIVQVVRKPAAGIVAAYTVIFRG